MLEKTFRSNYLQNAVYLYTHKKHLDLLCELKNNFKVPFGSCYQNLVGSYDISPLCIWINFNNQAVDFTLTPKQIDRLNEASNYKPPFPHNFLTPQLIDSMVDGETEIQEAELIKQREKVIASRS